MPGRKSVQFCGITKRYGTSFDSKRWLVLDPCGFMGVTVSWSVHIYAIVILAWKVIWVTDLLVSKILYFGLYLPVSVLAMISLYKATTTDPGAVPLGARPFTTFRRAASGEMIPHTVGDGDRAVRRCHKCQDNYKPVRAHHDSITGRCIVKFDHFCPWVNNAVGALNHKFFCLFLLYTALSCFLSLALLLIRVIHCTTTTSSAMNKATSSSSTSSSSSLFAKTHPQTDVNDFINNNESDNGSLRFLKHVSDNRSSSSIYTGQCSDFMTSHLVLALLIASIVFLIFTIAMSCEQIEAIETGKGKIARMKQSVGTNGTEFQRVTEEFNEMFGGTTPRLAWHWLLPIDIRFPKGMKKIVLGYDWDPSFPPVPFQENNVVTTNNVPSPTNNNGHDKAMSDLEAPGLYSMDNRNTYTNRVVDESTTFKARSAPDRSNSSDGMTIPSASTGGTGRSPLMRRKVFSRGSGSTDSNEDEDYLETISIQSAPTDLSNNMNYTGTPGDGLYRLPQPESLIRKEVSLGSSSVSIPIVVGSTTINSASSTIFQRKQSSRSNSDDTGIALVDRGTTPPSSSNSSTNGGNNNNNTNSSTSSTNRQTIPKIV